MNPTAVFGVVWIWLMLIVGQLVLPLVDFDPQARLYFSNVVQLVTSLGGALICFLAVLTLPTSSPFRRGWLLIALGIAAWGLGQGIFALYPLSNNGEDPPYPYYSDIGFLLCNPLIAMGLLTFYRSMGLTAPVWGKALSVVLFVGLGYWCYRANAEGLVSGEFWLVVVSFGYAALDPLLVAIAIFVASSFRAATDLGRSWWMVVVGAVIMVIGNQVWSYLVLIEVYQTGSIVDISWPVAFGLMAWAAVYTRETLR